MDKAKAAVHDFIHRSGQHDTTVHEKVAPAVVQETVHTRKVEEVQPVIDREVHKDHYHTSVQPIKDREVLPEQHVHQVAPVEQREHHHGSLSDIKPVLQQEAAQFHDVRVKGRVEETRQTAPTVVGEHVHHHVHETIQPVIQKETIQPHIVHTTVPVHEVHHQAPEHHSTSALPAVSMADFKKQGGVLTGREERYDAFQGEPRTIGTALGAGAATGTGAGLTRRDSSSSSESDNQGGRRKKTGLLGKATRHTENHGNTTSATGTGHKPTLMEKLDPRVDANGDGKKGFMK